VPVFVIFVHFEPFFNAVSEEPRWYVILSIVVVQPHLYLQYFLSRLHPLWLYNRACKLYTTAIKCLFSISVLFSQLNVYKGVMVFLIGFQIFKIVKKL